MSKAVPMFVVLALVALCVIVVRIRLLDLPLERDEGEFALMGQMILRGIPPYQEAYNLKPPGIYLAYAGMMAAFGESPRGIHTGLLLVNLACASLLFWITRKMSNPLVAASSTAAFLALTLMPKVLGLSAHATHFVLLTALVGILLLQTRIGDGPAPAPAPGRRGQLIIFLSGIFMGLSILMKQPGFFFALFGAVILWRRRGRGALGEFVLYAIGILLPIATTFIWLFRSGVFDRFWFWVVTYALSYGAEVGFIEGLDIALDVGWSILLPSLAIFLCAIAGIAVVRSPALTSGQRFFIVALFLASILGVAMGFHFRRHYFVLILPVVSVSFGLGLSWIGEKITKKEKLLRVAPGVVGVLALLAIGQTFAASPGIYFSTTPNQASRAMFGANPFVESAWIGERVRELAATGERVAVIGSEPQLYFYADRLPATGYIYMYSLVDDRPIAEKMRKEMIAEVENRRPAVLIYVNNPSSWLLDKTSDRSIFSWLEGYVEREGYSRVGVIDIISPVKTVSLLGEQARGYRPVGGNFIELWSRGKHSLQNDPAP